MPATHSKALTADGLKSDWESAKSLPKNERGRRFYSILRSIGVEPTGPLDGVVCEGKVGIKIRELRFQEKGIGPRSRVIADGGQYFVIRINSEGYAVLLGAKKVYPPLELELVSPNSRKD